MKVRWLRLLGMTSEATTVDEYLAELSEDRREILSAVREVINRNKPDSVVEGMTYGMIGWFVPHSVYPDGYHCNPKMPLPFINLGSQKNHIGLYMFCLYTDNSAEAFKDRVEAAGGKIDMGKGCARFKKLSDLPLDVVAETVRSMRLDQFIEQYEASIPPSKRKKKA